MRNAEKKHRNAKHCANKIALKTLEKPNNVEKNVNNAEQNAQMDFMIALKLYLTNV